MADSDMDRCHAVHRGPNQSPLLDRRQPLGPIHFRLNKCAHKFPEREKKLADDFALLQIRICICLQNKFS